MLKVKTHDEFREEEMIRDQRRWERCNEWLNLLTTQSNRFASWLEQEYGAFTTTSIRKCALKQADHEVACFYEEDN